MTEREYDAIWADESGVQLILFRAENGAVMFRFASPTGEWHADATISQFRLKRIASFIEPSLEAERHQYDDPEDYEAPRTEAMTPQLSAFRAAAARFRDAGQLDGVSPFGWFLAGMAAVDLAAPFEPLTNGKEPADG